MLKWFTLLLVVGILLLPGTAQAQDKPQIGNLEIELWPEYDQPIMLVIFHITLAPNIVLPAPMEIRIPARAGQPHAVAVRQPDGSLINLNYEVSSDGTWVTIQAVANLPEIRIEYYDPGLEKEGVQRTFTFEWPGDYKVADSLVSILQPIDASNLSVSPGPVTSFTTSDGLTYFNKTVGSLAEGQSFKIDLTYSKESDTLSVASLPVQPAEPLTQSTNWQDKMIGALPWILGTAGVLLIAGGALWYWQSGRQPQPSKSRGRGSRRRSAAADQTTASGDIIYCHQCGKRAASGDRFCRVCGTRLRVD